MNHKQVKALENKRLFAREVAKEVFIKKIIKNEDTASHEIRKLFNITRQAFRHYYTDAFFLKELEYYGVEMINGGNSGHVFKVKETDFLKKKGIESHSQEEST
ncbi:hypothetical protein M3196_00360 [Fictibacillus nanhaiensis]|uniref:hypothetical protein n=1 Tax=Fictibacillus nanhaiensis TaxID=742169 RepID=UPI0020406AE5|nr:hypothetical protein [Fictibacillus nanhaiensis]MCM3730120.1 hypothetical protein [Fictibacillus nanhaiensis]